MESRDIYIKLSDPTGKHKPVVNAHRVWDGARFIDSQHKQYERDAKPEDRRVVTEATRAEYQSFWFELIRPDKAFRQAVEDELGAIAGATGLSIINGKK